MRLILSYLATGLGLIALARAAQFTQPLRESGPDPFVVFDHDTSTYLFMQTNGNILRVTSAPTLGGTGDFANERVVYQDQDMIDRGGVWAPEIHNVNGKWYIYYTMDGGEVWVVSGGDKPLDPYTNPTKLFDHYGIDGTVLKHKEQNYFVWCCHSGDVSDDKIDGSSLCISPLTTPTSIDQGNVAVISRPKEAWEEHGGNTNEGPQPIYWAGETYLTYSASHCSTAFYSLGMLHLTGPDPMNPLDWTKKTDGPVFDSGNGEYGPGHNGIFNSPDGTELWNVYHATTNAEGSCGDDRATFAMKVDTSNGLNFGTPVAKGTVTEGPSGERRADPDADAVPAATTTLVLTDDATDTAPPMTSTTASPPSETPSSPAAETTVTYYATEDVTDIPPAATQAGSWSNWGGHWASWARPTDSGHGPCVAKRAKLAAATEA
ncbi:hypothetical protein IAU60_006814 [Kwoniella sp. DSM 27419]